MKIDWEKFKIVCKKCGKEPEVEENEMHACSDCSAPGSINMKCECREEENYYL